MKYAIPVLLVSLPACLQTTQHASDDRVASSSESIVNGSLDTTHQAVIAIYSQNALCTGTIVKVDGSYGYVLTAAHCCQDNPEYVIQGNNYYSDSSIAYPIVDYLVHSQYDSDSGYYDYAMIKFTGAGSSTPTIPVLKPSEDDLASGDEVLLVGYGRTEDDDANTKRHYIYRNLDSVSSLMLSFDQSTGGQCFGDSGGPQLVEVNGSERVAGVAWSVSSGSCFDMGYSGRASSVYSSFIQPYLTGTASVMSCTECAQASQVGVGTCTDEVSDCYNYDDCSALIDCFDSCNDGDDTCHSDCATDHPSGSAKYDELINCICDDACPTECATECQAPETTCGGYTFNSDSCDACLEASCCSEAEACSESSSCNECATNADATGCGNNSKYNAFVSCLTDNCSSACGWETGEGGSSPGTSSGGGGSGDGGSDSSSAGGATSDPEGDAGGDERDDELISKKNDTTEDGCSHSPGSRSSQSGLPILVLLGLAAAAARKRALCSLAPRR